MLTVEQTVEALEQIVRKKVTKKRVVARAKLNGLKTSARLTRMNTLKNAGWKDFQASLAALIYFLRKQDTDLPVPVQEAVEYYSNLEKRP